jgi:hypothetical protein
VGMKDNESSAENLPLSNHLKEDISAATDSAEETDNHFTPGQTNAGQQVAGLASATDYGEDEEHGSGTDASNPV